MSTVHFIASWFAGFSLGYFIGVSRERRAWNFTLNITRDRLERFNRSLAERLNNRTDNTDQQ